MNEWVLRRALFKHQLQRTKNDALVLYEVRRIHGAQEADGGEAVPSKEDETFVVFVLGTIGKEEVNLKRLKRLADVHIARSCERHFLT